MTLIVFLGVVVSLLILRLIPNLLLRLALAIPRHHLIAIMQSVPGRKIGIALPRKSAAALSESTMAMSSVPASGRLKFVLVSSSLLVLAVLVSTAFWTWHSTGLMMLLR
jgi:hypothetical protein